MNQLQRFVSGDNVTTRFSYYGNTGLIESRDDQGSVRLVEYDDVGHVTSLVLANGNRVWLNEGGAKAGRACFDVTGDISTVALTVGDSGTTFTRGILFCLITFNVVHFFPSFRYIFAVCSVNVSINEVKLKLFVDPLNLLNAFIFVKKNFTVFVMAVCQTSPTQRLLSEETNKIFNWKIGENMFICYI